MMKNIANSRFSITGWDEKPYSEGQDLPKLTRAAVTKTFTGDIAGEGHVEYLMMYASDGSATFVGLERIVGRVGRESRQLRAPAYRSIRERRGEGVLCRGPWLRDRGASGPARRGYVGCRARH